MFKSILADQWESLSPILQKHFGLTDGEEIRMLGKLAVKHGTLIKIFMPLVRLMGALVPVEGDDFEVMVENKRVGDTLYWHREFKKDNKVYVFNSKMQQVDNDIIEFIGFGMGIRLGLKITDIGLKFVDKGYVLKIGKIFIPMPLHLFMGRTVIEEFTNENNPNDLEMEFVMQHPWFGFTFSYKGYFNLHS